MSLLFCGPTFRQFRICLRTHLNSLATVLARLRAQSASDHEPSLALNRHSDICEFKQLCRAKAVEADNLTLLKGMPPKEVTHQNSRGIFSIKQLSYTFRLRRPSRRQKQQFRHNFALQALALRENKIHVLGEPILTLPRTQVYFDIEGLPDRGVYYLVGVLIVTEQSHQYHCLWSDDENNQVSIFTEFVTLLSELSDWRLFHYGNYEVNALRRMLLRLPESCQQTLRAMLANCINVLSIVSSHVYFPTMSNSLKDVAGFLGFRWTSAEASGLKSVVWREQWEEAGDARLKEKLRDYNRDDCSALRVVTEFIASITARGSKDRSAQANLDAIVDSNQLLTEVSHKHKFGKKDFCLPDFEFVNRCAYFDYHRDKINVRSGKRSISTKLRSARKRPLRAKVNKHIEIRCKRCPHCNNRRLSEVRALSTRRIDMKFFGGGVKKWVTVYYSWSYRCGNCEKTFTPPDYPQTAMRYGNNLENWVVYQNVAMGQNVNKIRQCLEEVFKLHIPQPTIYRFKAAVSNRYKATNIAIIDGLLRGPS